MAEVNFIDGQALDATSFGEFKSGVWIPKSYSGSYGTNGFYLDFGNSGSLGADSSGNGNNWTPNNLAATDQVPDSPTNNFATLNPVNTTGSGAITFLEGNLKAAGYAKLAFSTINPTSGKYYFEALLIDPYVGGGGINHYGAVFLAPQNTTAVFDTSGIGTGARMINYTVYGGFYSDGTRTSAYTSWVTNDVIGFAIDYDAQTMAIYQNGVLKSTETIGANDTTIGVALDGTSGDTTTDAYNFGQDSSFAGSKTAQGNTDARGIGDFYYAPPAGYLALCTANLPDPAIDPAQDDVPEDYFNTVLYQGDGSSPRSVTGVGFQPDFTWLKNRSSAYVHGVSEAVRGGNAFLVTNSNISERVNEIDGYLSSFDSDGFTLTAGTNSNGTFNAGSNAYVSWNWKADGSGVTNTDGTITSTVSANQKAGFSIVSYATGGLPNATVGHGLSQPPEIIIAKQRDANDIWLVLTNKIDGSVDYLVLNTTAAKADYASGALTSSTFTNPYASSSDVIAYCFHSVEGYSKFGSYTGNGSTDGPFVYTGFRPAFVMVKNTSIAEDWVIVNTETDTYNVTNKTLKPNSSQAELVSTVSSMDIVSNGIKLRTADTKVNGNGNTFIYMAFAEMPFKYSNAR